MQVEKYIGLQYKEKGRDFDGVDCWGLVRLFYKNEYQIDLPSFTSEYAPGDSERIEELFALNREGWESLEQPEEGSVVLFRILGTESHVGIVVNSEQFLHVREGKDSAIENFNSALWKKRIVGYFKYSENKSVILNAVPHPLKTQRYTLPIIPGLKLSELTETLNKEYNVAQELRAKINIILNGYVIDKKYWDDIVLKEGDKVEYRAVPGDDKTVRTLGTVGLVVLAAYTGGLAAGALGYSGVGAMTATQAIAYTAAAAATTLVGTSLINAIAPIRPPVNTAGKDPGSAERQLMVNGGGNQLRPYGSIPVVLGKVRVTPPLGSVNYLTYENERDSYISMLLVWGYGPLQIYAESVRIGDIPLTNYEEYEIIHDKRVVELSETDKIRFDTIYGKDITQVEVATELTCDGNPESTVEPGPWLQASTNETMNVFTIALHFPQGLRKIKIKDENAGDSYGTTVKIRIESSTDNGATWKLNELLTVGGSTPKKDAFTITRTYGFIFPSDNRIVRVRRETGDNTEDDPSYRYYFTSVLQSVTFTRNASPAVDPLNTKIAKSALKIKATDQLNGRIEGINSLVQTWCKIWDGTTWFDSTTSNPAALFRYVLEHPANPRRITNPSTQIDLNQLQYFYNYCQAKGFEYNSILADSRSVLDVLRDICAAGRASPAMIDGKWTVIIDEPKLNVIQHFTPHNSWGFEGSKPLPKKPDGLRVTYFDQDKDYQENEIIVYDIGKNSTNSTLFESITLPGVTKKSLIIDHARWHLAQIKLRPEVYTLNADIEYLVCNRGDRVKVTHDVPMWGIGSGRIKNRLSATQFQLDEEMPMKAGVQYTIRVRSANGSSVVRTVVSKPSDGNYDIVDVTSSTTSTGVRAGDLFLFGEINKESQDLLVLSVEPSGNKSARLTLVDYGVTDQYNIFNNYVNLSESTVFESQISSTPILQIENFGTKIPTITGFVSDESVMERVSKGVFRYNINVAYVNAAQLPQLVESVEVQYDLASSNTTLNAKSIFVPYQKGSAQIADIAEGEVYKVRMRYIGRNGKVGNWTAYSNHTVVGKTNPPSSVTGFAVTPDKSSGQLQLSWNSNLEIDVFTYEIRQVNSLWGTDDSDRLFYGDATKAFVKYTGESTKTYYIKAVDSAGNYSVGSTSVTFTAATIPNVIDLTATFSSSEESGSVYTFSWFSVSNSEFDVDTYELSYDDKVVSIKGNSISIPANWIGDKTFVLKVVDIFGRKSSGFSKVVNRARPSQVSGFTINPDKSSGQLQLSWNSNPEVDVAYYEVRTQDTGWGINTSERLFYGKSNKTFVKYSGEISVTLYIRASDFFGNYTEISAVQTFSRQEVPNVSGFDYTYEDTSLTSAVVNLNWSDITASEFDIAYYEISFDSETKTVKGNNLTLAANWIGSKIFTIKGVDINGNKSSGISTNVVRLIPNSPLSPRTQVIDNTVMLYWILPNRTSLPIDHVLLKKGLNWETAEVLGEKKGEFTTVTETLGGEFTYWLACVDTEGAVSTPVSITTLVSEPPDFVFNGEFFSYFNGSKSNAVKDNSTLILPVNTTETWEQHFTTRSWNTPQNQINAGYPIFIQPSSGTGYYEEVFDFQQPLASSKVSLSYNGTVIAGNPQVAYSIGLSLDNITFTMYNGLTEVFGTNFRYVKVRVDVVEPSSIGLYSIKDLKVRLDAKLKNDAGSVNASASDSSGTVVNFNKDFIDVQSVTVSPSGTTPIIPVYDIQDAFVSGTYSVSSNVCTVTISNHGFITGQNVKLFINSGSGISDTYAITSYTTNTFTVNMTTTNTSGNISLYPQSMRVYLFNTSGNRVSANVSWAIKGY